jgi:hypothetical protein
MPIRRRKNPVPKSSREQRLQQAAILYERFSGNTATEILRFPAPKCPKELVAIGPVDGILYSADREGRVEKYIHEFRKKARPLLAVSPDGSSLYLLGGAFTFTERGIVDD